ncbi:hypothetical protein DQ04_00161130 [Trypanosoma grayi]|uniref:hypothetical protein n=1 Tax=Trypanosoma grayi TaxID=71804 RepID=UPI0004F44E8C|nr:hypothetical protein DQ04_00161130 [Trypanosoma grayi]KEG15173.1 hypothetical protein DQ04_00161130 [Trypanosoma grayi]
MDISAIVVAFQRVSPDVSHAVRVLFNYAHPLSEREAAQLTDFLKRQQEAGQQGGEVPDDIRQLMERPLQRLSAATVVQCVVGAAKIPSFPTTFQRRLQRKLLHLVAKRSPLSLEEWGSILHHAAALPMAYSPAALRCVEEVLKAAAPVVLASTAAQTENVPGKEVRVLFLKTFAAVVMHYATRHAARAKHSTLPDTIVVPRGKENFLTSSPVRRLRRIIEVNCGNVQDVWRSTVQSLSPAESVVLFVAAPWPSPVPKEALLQVVKGSPTLLLRLLGTRPAAGTLVTDSPNDVIHACAYNMGLTNCSLDSARDYLAVLMALSVESKAAYYRSQGKDGFSQLLIPFVNNAKVLNPAVAQGWREFYTLLFMELGAEEEFLPPFLQAASYLVVNRCRSATEKASIMIISNAVMRQVSDATRSVAPTEDLARMIEQELASPANDAALAAWRLLRVSAVENEVVEEMRSALKSAKSNESLRRAMLLHISADRAPADILEGLTEPLLEECGEVEVYRPDAFLALRIAVKRKPAVVAKLCPILCHADVLAQLGINADELNGLAETAVELSKHCIFAPIALLLTHKSGLLRRRICCHISTLMNDASSVISLWDSVTQTVFGLETKDKAKILSNTAVGTLLPIAPALLQNISRTVVTSTLCELVLCCGHDHIQGEDPYYYHHNGSLLGRARTSSKVVQRQLFDGLFSGEHKHLFMLHNEAIAEKLCAAFNGPTHLRTAASRGLVLLLGLLSNPSSSQPIFEKLLNAAKQSAEYMVSLDARDRAIAASSVTALLEYETHALREQQLLKSYPDKPPKGMQEDDYEDMKQKDAIALKNGREVLRKDIEKRRHVIEDTVQQRKTALATIRTLGTSGHFCLVGVATLYPYLQEALNRDDVPEVLERHLVDAISGLLSRTVFAYMAENMARTVAQLDRKTSLSVGEVSRISTMAMHLRQALTQMIPAPLFVVLLPFSRVAFKAGRGGNAVRTTIPVATQHQLMGVLMQNLGQSNLPQPTETLQLLSTILQNFPSLFKSVQQGINLLMAMIPASHLVALELGLFNQADAVKEVTAAAYYRFSHFVACRRALVLASIFLHDSSADVVRSMELVTNDSTYAFSLAPSDWSDLVYYLQTYGQQQKSHSMRIGETMRELFLLSSTTEMQQIAWLEDVKKIGGLGAVVAIQVLSSSLKGNSFQAALMFLCSMAESPSTEPLMRLILACGRVVLHDCTLEALKAMAGTLQARLSKPPRDITPAHKELYLATSTVWLTIISCRLKETALLESIIEQQSSTLNNSNSAMVHRAVCDSMVEITKNEDVRASPKLDEFVEKCLKQTIHSGSYIKKKAHAYGLVGVLQGLGLPSLRRYNIMETMQSMMREKQAERSGAMVLLEALSEVMGAKFEPYALAMCSGLLEGIADKDQKVSECADDASRVMVSSLTAVGLRQLIPRLVDGLSADQAKMRVPPLNFIGYVAFCSPKQLAATLPEITKHINACLFDVNHNVSEAAMSALRRVAGVVSNAEIREHVEVILKALRSPNTETENALDALLYTRFVNAVDPASLALIVPILSRGLSNQMPHLRPKAAQIVASMVSLVNDPKSLKPYCEELVKLLESAAEDPMSESRTTSAKAIAALAAAIGGKIVDDIVAWCFATLQKPNVSTVEKAGAAQVFVEIVESCGDSILYDSFPIISAGMVDERPPVREGFLHIMVYSPSTFSPATFQRFLPLAFPWVLEGLSHFSDRVRDVALVAGSGIINLYGTRNLALVLDPLLGGVVSEVTTLRQSSMLLASKLLIHLVQQIRKKMRIQAAKESVAGDNDKVEELEQMLEQDPEVAEDAEAGGMLQMEAARDFEKRGVSILGSLEEILGTDGFTRLLSAMYCGRHEHNLGVRTDTNNAWQTCVASLRSAVKKIFKGLVDVLVLFSSSENPDCVDMAIRTIEFTSRLNEMIEPFIDELCNRYKEDKRRSKLGALTCLANIVVYLDSRRLIGVGGQIVGCVLPGMQEKDTRVQQCAREVFAKVSKSVGPRLIEDAIEAQIETSVRGVVEVVKVKPSVALEIVFRYLAQQSTYTQGNLELLDAILDVEEADEQMRRYVEATGRTLLAFLVQDLDGASETYQKFVENLEREFEHLPMEQWRRDLRAPATQRGALLAAEAYGLGISMEYIEGISEVFRAAIESLASDNEEIRGIAVAMIPRLIASLEQRVVESLEEEEQQDLTTSKRAAGRYLLQYLDVFQQTLGVTARSVVTEEEPEFSVLGSGEPTRLFDALMAFYNRGLDYGTSLQKVEAVECIQDLLTYAPRSVSAGAANTVAGRCSKVLFTRNEGTVVLALVKLCLQLMNYPASGKEKMVEGTMALAMFNAALCDAGEARVLALRVVIQLLQRSEKYADLILGTVVTKKAAVDSPLLRGVMCRFISVVVRYSNFTKALSHITKLMDIVTPIWERAETPATTAVAGVAVAALCKSASITDEQLGMLQEKALTMMATKGAAALGGFAFVYSLATCCAERADAVFFRAAASGVRAAAAFGASDKLSIIWLLRAAAALAGTGKVGADELRAEVYTPLLRRVDVNDEQMMSTAQYYYDVLAANFPAAVAGAVEELPREASTQWCFVGHFDADLDDEVAADTTF